MSPTAEIEWQQARVTRGGRAVLDAFSLGVARGEFLVMLGRSGAGKSTALQTVNRLLELDGGTLSVQGRLVRDWDPIALRRGIGYVIQDVGLFPHFTVARNVGLVPALLGWPREQVRERVRELLDMVGLAAARFGSRLPQELSAWVSRRLQHSHDTRKGSRWARTAAPRRGEDWRISRSVAPPATRGLGWRAGAPCSDRLPACQRPAPAGRG